MQTLCWQWHFTLAANLMRQQKPITVWIHMCCCAKSLQSCPTLRDPTDYSLPGSSVNKEQEYSGKNTGVGCHALLQGIFPILWICISSVHSVVSDSLWPHESQHARPPCPSLTLFDLSESTQTHVHRVGDAIQLSHGVSSPFPPAPNPSQHQSLFQWVNSLHEVAKVLEFQL